MRGAGGLSVVATDGPFIAGEIADRGPLERPAGALDTPADVRARDARERQRQREWREQAARAIGALRVEEGTRPINADEIAAAADLALVSGLVDDFEPEEPEEPEEPDEGEGDAGPLGAGFAAILRVDGAGTLPTIRVLPQGLSRKRLELAVRELQLPVLIARDVDDADVVMTLKNEYRQKTPLLREAEERAMPIYVLKDNTTQQIQASLTSIFALELDPREAAMRETEEAIDIVLHRSEPVELSPQNAYIRRLQHQMAERANLVSRSRGREPYRRVRLYPDVARSAWR
ncbi:MAG: R3H domain-containing nucleic acid-binding protein [Candidatus Limnocylindrales bacterium]